MVSASIIVKNKFSGSILKFSKIGPAFYTAEETLEAFPFC